MPLCSDRLALPTVTLLPSVLFKGDLWLGVSCCETRAMTPGLGSQQGKTLILWHMGNETHRQQQKKKKDNRNVRREMYGCIINCTALDFLSDGTPKYAPVRVVVFKPGLIFICFLCFILEDRNKCHTRTYVKKHSSLLQHQEPWLHIKEDQIILWPLGPFEVMHTKLRVIKTHASGHTLIISRVRKNSPLFWHLALQEEWHWALWGFLQLQIR